MGKFQNVEQFDTGKTTRYEELLKLKKDSSKSLNIPSEVWKFPDGLDLIGKYVKSEIIRAENGKKEFKVFIFEHIEFGTHHSLAGAMFAKMEDEKTLVPGRVYIICPPIKKEWDGKQYKDFPIYDITEDVIK